MNTWGRRQLGILVLSMLLGALLGGALAASRPTMYTSRAVSTVGVDARAADPAVVQGVTSSVFMMMPAYAEQAKSGAVVDAAAQASGLTADQIRQGLGVERSADSTVLKWTFQAADPARATVALRAATEAFSAELPKQGPRGEQGSALLRADVTQAAGPGVGSRITVGVGALAGAVVAALAVLAARLLLRRGPGNAVGTWDDLELRLGIPVVAELSPDVRTRARQWGYVATRLRDLGAERRVGVFRLSTTVRDSDAEELRDALSRSRGSAVPVVRSAAVASSLDVSTQDVDGAVLLIDSTEHPESDLAGDCRAISRIVPGPVIGVLDRRTPVS